MIIGLFPRSTMLNRELACLEEMWNVACMSAIKSFADQHIRNRVLTPEEFERMVELSPDRWKPISLCACLTGMRKAQTLNLK